MHGGYKPACGCTRASLYRAGKARDEAQIIGMGGAHTQKIKNKKKEKKQEVKEQTGNSCASTSTTSLPTPSLPRPSHRLLCSSQQTLAWGMIRRAQATIGATYSAYASRAASSSSSGQVSVP